MRNAFGVRMSLMRGMFQICNCFFDVRMFLMRGMFLICECFLCANAFDAWNVFNAQTNSNARKCF